MAWPGVPPGLPAGLSWKAPAVPTAPTLTTNNGLQIPQLGWGVMHIADDQMTQAFNAAIDAGYRLIDTAQAYGNEQSLGTAIAQAAVPRDELFITTKLANDHQGHDKALKAFDGSMERLGLEVLDLFLIHWPLPMLDQYVETWQVFEEILASGRVRSIGVSNFTQKHLQRLFEETSIVPVLNQVEMHPRFPQDELRRFHAEHGILTEAWSPLERGRGLLEESGQTGKRSLLEEPVIVKLAGEKGKTPAQIVLRWHIQVGSVPIPKSGNLQRMRENIEVFDFELAEEDMSQIAALSGERLGPDPDMFSNL
jgi:2,5-diketo-D-gluconate reductase A